MTEFLISFNEGAMDHISADDIGEVGDDVRAVVREATEAGVWVYGGGLDRQRASIVGTDGSVTDGPYPETKEVVGGFSVVNVATRDEALHWAAKLAAACRCAQEVRELMPDAKMDEFMAERSAAEGAIR
jgi:hypothetical protein